MTYAITFLALMGLLGYLIVRGASKHRKPRVSPRRIPGRFRHIRIWKCHDSRASAFGWTPDEAYRAWYLRAKRNRGAKC